jgi:diacylglycerol O-acyltransferase
MRASPPPRRRPAVAGELALVAFLLFGYDRVAGLANVRVATGVRTAEYVLAIERYVHLDVELALNRALAAHHRLGQVLSVYYYFAHATVTFGVLLVPYLSCDPGYRRARRTLVAVNGIALAVFVVLPVAPPRLLPGAGFVDVVAGSGTWGAWEAETSTLGQHANQYAAMPSLHVAWATWVLLAVCSAHASPQVRGLAVLHLSGTIAVVLVTGNHYVLDVAVGAVLATVSWAASAPWRELVPAVPGRPAPAPGPVEPALSAPTSGLPAVLVDRAPQVVASDSASSHDRLSRSCQ